MNYQPGSSPRRIEDLSAYITRELQRLTAAIRDDAPRVHYLTDPLSPAYGANNFAPTGLDGANVLRISASATQTITGIMPVGPWRELTVVNVGTGTVVLTSQDTASSASSRFALAATLNLSANAAVHLWYDAITSRWRAVGSAGQAAATTTAFDPVVGMYGIGSTISVTTNTTETAFDLTGGGGATQYETGGSLSAAVSQMAINSSGVYHMSWEAVVAHSATRTLKVELYDFTGSAVVANSERRVYLIPNDRQILASNLLVPISAARTFRWRLSTTTSNDNCSILYGSFGFRKVANYP